ncbi:uncharacterized protein B0T15DRAFT_105889 [Chaetomium strumarium]|uniref:Uncharacterized protein n=1 Tax=Chaetomium strumarium TaxID=1170767 RepID=A0AAJ0GY73_9PEZI|nr:hypothetical protein B0T15DRAFT_105889 [Chaetomium strumarium]
MCGEETPSSTPRVGARVDFYPASGLQHTHLPVGNLVFLNPSSPSSCHATHVRFSQRPSTSTTATATTTTTTTHTHEDGDESVLVSIHMTGDLTKPLADSGLLRRFTFRPNSSSSSSSSRKDDDGVEMPLPGEALSLNVGNDGIIGRRVSMMRGNEVLADGIVGFNFLPVVAADA